MWINCTIIRKKLELIKKKNDTCKKALEKLMKEKERVKTTIKISCVDYCVDGHVSFNHYEKDAIAKHYCDLINLGVSLNQEVTPKNVKELLPVHATISVIIYNSLLALEISNFKDIHISLTLSDLFDELFKTCLNKISILFIHFFLKNVRSNRTTKYNALIIHNFFNYW